MKVWIVESTGYSEVISVRSSRETAIAAAETWLREGKCRFTGEGYTGLWTDGVVKYGTIESQTLPYDTPRGKSGTMSVYAMELEN